LLAAGAYLTWSIIMKNTTRGELDRVLNENDCSTTPFWRSEESVVNLLKQGRVVRESAERYARRINGE
jgi:hypothetical protein